MSTLAANECRRQLRYNFTDSERIDKAKGLAEALNRSAATEAELSRIKSDYKARLEAIQAEVDLLNGAVLSGYELREYVCFWTYDEPRHGRKTLRKREGGEIVGEEDMTERDRQMVMEIVDAQAAVASTATGAGEKLALPAVVMPRSAADVLLDEDACISFDFDAGLCLAFSQALFDVFVVEAEDGTDALRDDTGRENAAAALFTKDEKWLSGFARWLREEPRASVPGAHWLACAVEAELKGRAIAAEGAKAKAAAEKKAARTKGRRASGAGTVEVEADEGSRDDCGPDSKNDL